MAGLPTVLRSRVVSSSSSLTVAKHAHTCTVSGSRPARAADSFTVCTARAAVSSEKKVRSTTAS